MVFGSVMGQATQVTLNQMQNANGDAISIPNCNHHLIFHVVVGAMTDVVTFDVDWGDGTQTDSIFHFSPGMHYAILSHEYAQVGANVATYSVHSEVSAQTIINNAEVVLVTAPNSACGIVSNIYVAHDNSMEFYNDAPLDFVGADGVITTIQPVYFPGILQSFYFGLDIHNVPYQVQANSGWLTSENLQALPDSIQIHAFNDYNYGLASGNTVYVTCATPDLLPDVTVSNGWPWNFVAPLETGFLQIELNNLACQHVVDAHVTVEILDDFIPVMSDLTNAQLNGNMLSFDLIDLGSQKHVTIPFTFPGTTPAGTQICFPITISAPDDINLINNAFNACGVVFNSYDPNDKQVNHPAIIDPDTQQTFAYQIRFQNDGNFPAVNVVIRDTLSENLDLSTFRFLNSSHPVSYQINPTTRELTFTFNGIWLESSEIDVEASQGFIRYEIKEKAGLVEGDAIENTAYIFFDFNPPIVTNTTINTNAYPLSLQKIDLNEITMYPNPSSGLIQFSGADVERVVVYDLLGKVYLSKKIMSNKIQFDDLNSGIYFVEMHTALGIETRRLVLSK